MPRFVLEIGTEELPPRYFPSALSQLKSDGEAMLARARLAHRDLKVYGTPRRLVLIVEEIAPIQAPAIREERGPSAKVAFDAEDKPTKAALGFAKRHGVPPGTLERRQTEQGEYIFAIIQEPEALAKEALAALLPDLITGLSFPKSMRWGAGTLRFGRPVRWLLALVDDEVVAFSLAGLTSGRLTRGHPTLADGMFEVKHAAEYERALEERFVIVEPEKRRAAIKKQLREISEQAGAPIVAGSLLEETIFLVEFPTAALGRFDPSYLRLPRPVLVEEMQHVQSYFPLEGQEARRESREELQLGKGFWDRPLTGQLMSCFIAFRDGGKDNLETVVAGWESVLRAKLIDASYFYGQDLKRPLADRAEDLKGVVFQENLGSMYEKMERVRAIAAALAGALGISPKEKAALDRAALLCKADLTTEMVAELSNLQGVMGGEYALRIQPAESEEVAQAIADHYSPRFADDEMPRTPVGQLLAVADKLDTIAALFAIGVVPTGSADPFGLRREAAGVVTVLLGADLSVSSRRLVEVALAALEQQVELQRAKGDIVGDVLAFLGQRLETSLRDDGIRYDLVAAALAVGVDDIRLSAERARDLRQVSESPDFLPTVIASTRVSNIVKGFAGGDVNPVLFEHDSERALWSAYQRALPEVERAAEARDYEGLFRTLGTLRGPIDRFFDDVLVMAEDEKIRNNRLALCWQINQLFRRLADFTLVVQA